MPKHSWSQAYRPDHFHTFRRCWNCGMERVTRHESGQHWIEWRKNGQPVKSHQTPICESIEANHVNSNAG